MLKHSRLILWRLFCLFLILVGANFSGYAYACLIRSNRLAQEVTPTPSLGMLLPSYAFYVRGVARLVLGQVSTSSTAVLPVIIKASTASVGLLTIAVSFSVVLGVSLGLVSVRGLPARVSPWLVLVSGLGSAAPSFYIGSLLVLAIVLIVVKSPFPAPLPAGGFGWDRHLIAPVLTLMVRPTLRIARVVADWLVDELAQPYVILAMAFGFPWRVIRWRLVARNMVAPVVLVIFGSVRAVISDLVTVEWLFYWPGLGRLLAMTLVSAFTIGPTAPVSTLFLDPPLVAATVTTFVAFFLVTDQVASLLVWRFAPRLNSWC